MTSYRARAYLFLILTAVIWGAASPVIKYTLDGIDPLPFLAYRFAIASIFSILYFLFKGLRLPKLKTALPIIAIYGLLAVPIALGALFSGLDRSTVLDLTLIGVLVPLLVTAGGAIFFRDHITRREKIGIAIVFIGVLINALAPFYSSGKQIRLTGNFFLLAFLLADTSSVLVAKKATRAKIRPSTLTNFAFIIGALTIIPIAITTQGASELISAITELPLKYHLGIWYMALISGNLAYFLYVRGHRSIEVSEATLFNYLQPVFAVPLAIFWLGEKITPTFIVGAVFITLGLIFAEYKRSLRS